MSRDHELTSAIIACCDEVYRPARMIKYRMQHNLKINCGWGEFYRNISLARSAGKIQYAVGGLYRRSPVQDDP